VAGVGVVGAGDWGGGGDAIGSEEECGGRQHSRCVSPGTGTGTRPSLLLYINDGPGGLVVYSTVDLVDESTCENYQGFTCEVSSEAATARSTRRSTHCGSIGACVLTARLVIVHLQEPECWESSVVETLPRMVQRYDGLQMAASTFTFPPCQHFKNRNPHQIPRCFTVPRILVIHEETTYYILFPTTCSDSK
jgi:hypothetical protein